METGVRILPNFSFEGHEDHNLRALTKNTINNRINASIAAARHKGKNDTTL